MQVLYSSYSDIYKESLELILSFHYELKTMVFSSESCSTRFLTKRELPTMGQVKDGGVDTCPYEKETEESRFMRYDALEIIKEVMMRAMIRYLQLPYCHQF